MPGPDRARPIGEIGRLPSGEQRRDELPGGAVRPTPRGERERADPAPAEAVA